MKTDSKLKNNLTALMKDKKVNIETLHKQTGVSLATIKRMRTDEKANPTLSSLLPIAKYFDTTINDLIGLNELKNQTSKDDNVLTQWKNIPFRSWNIIQASNTNQPEFSEMIATDIQVSDDAFGLVVEDDDYIGIMKESILIIKPSFAPMHNDFVIMHKSNAPRYSLYKYIKHETDIYLKPLKSDFKMTLLDDNYHYIGVVLQIRMDIKQKAGESL